MNITRSLAHLATFVNGRAFRPEEKTASGLPVLRIRQLVDPEADFDYYDGPVDKRHQVNDGDLIFSWSATLATRLWNRGQAALNQHLFNVHPDAGVDKGWLRWTIEASLPTFRGMMHGSAMTHITNEMLRDVKVTVPPIEQQRRIADFLDDQVARLNRAAELRRSQVRLAKDRLESYRDATIDALGAPHVALGHLANFLTDGDWIESPFITESGVRLIQTGNVGRGEYREQGFKYISEDTFKQLGCTSVLPGDVLISRLSPPVGRACLAPTLDGSMITSVDVAILRSSRANHRYLVHALSTRRYLEDVAVASRGATMARISRSQLARFTVPLPDLSAQVSVASRMDEAASETARAGRLLDSSLDLLHERNQALINAAVTGRLDVTTARAVA